MEVPGKVGWPVLGDKSVDFYRDPLKFLSKKMAETKSQVFAARFLNKPTVFVCSNDAVSDILNDNDSALELGYEAFMGQVYGHNVLFSTNDFAHEFRKTLSLLFSDEIMEPYLSVLTQVLEKKMCNLNTGSPICAYKLFKEIFTEMCLSLFLGLDFTESEEMAQTIIALTITHWHGIISVPLEISLPGMGKSSTYSKALEAKGRLLEVIASQRQKKGHGGFPDRMENISDLDDSTINNHLLLFTSALVPKVLASICTSVCAEIGSTDKLSYQDEAHADPEVMENIFLECQRLFPPLLGGRRIAKQSCVAGGYLIPKDHAVMYMTQPAHRDGSVFEEPDTFNPKRWSNNPDLRDKLFVFGKGRRGCVGQQLAWHMLTKTMDCFMSRYKFEAVSPEDMTYKYIPVRRPRQDFMVKLTARAND